jgi:hypothetical protein
MSSAYPERSEIHLESGILNPMAHAGITQEDPRAKNEVLAREVNERIQELSVESAPGEEFEILCECGRLECLQTISITIADYESARDVGTHFILADGHEDPEVERVVDRRDGFLLVEKIGEAAKVAERADPRS